MPNLIIMVYNVPMITIKITENEKDQRLDRFLRKYYRNAPLSYIYKLLRTGVKVNGRRANGNARLVLGDELIIDITEEEEKPYLAREKIKTAKREFKIAYEDENIIVVDKPFGLLTHGTSEEQKDTLANQVIGYLIDKGDYDHRRERTFLPSPVNRLDRNTTGLVIFGKNAEALRVLSQMMREKGRVHRYYLALLHGKMKEPVTLSGRMEKHRASNTVRIKYNEPESGKLMETKAMPIDISEDYTLAEVELITGRTHQIRVQLAEAGHPIIGDPKYGDPKADARIKGKFHAKAQCLHAWRLVFGDCLHPLEYMSGKEIKSESPPWRPNP